MFGLKIVEFPTARMDVDTIYRNPKLRADDINRAFADPEVSAIIASIGGDDSVRILPYLDIDTILDNPKILMGYSDTTAITCFLAGHGLVTFNGPSIMAGFAQMRHLPSTFQSHVRSVLMEPTERFQFHPYTQWADCYLDWNLPNYDGETEQLRDNDEGWHWLQGMGSTQGRLFGGCIEVLEFLKGTSFWPKPELFDDAILFFETSEDKPTVSNVMYMLRNYGSMGILEKVRGVLIGRARSYSDEEKAELDSMVVRVVSEEFGQKDLPSLTNLDFGHTDPQWVMPLGVEAEIDCYSHTLSLIEPSTS